MKYPGTLRNQRQQEQGCELLRTIEFEAGKLGHE
jgi:hypothetical protein